MLWERLLKCFFVLFALLSFIISEPIVGGVISTNNLPFVVSIHRENTYCCLGSIVNSRFILTAAHSVYRDTMQLWPPYRILAGSNDRRSGIRYFVKRIFVHPMFDEYSRRMAALHDLAVLKLGRRIIFTPNIRPIRLPDKDIDITDNKTTVVVAGWGSRRRDGEISDTLVKAFGNIAFPRSATIVSAKGPFILVVGIRDKGVLKDGDAGGPLVYKGRIHGVASSLIRNTKPPMSIYMNVYRFKLWAKIVTGSLKARPHLIVETMRTSLVKSIANL